ncbi:AraC family transcriptional regulator [Pseudomonas sp. PP3]|uniref:helix-turn-helix domain-containing protein n=1 Tax=Pseudomonas sp. PP3 TaxID=2815936 RepID=UPI001FCFE583|nr:AraC family transcriptional regulator [Pseudomonas sp. PP3]
MNMAHSVAEIPVDQKSILLASTLQMALAKRRPIEAYEGCLALCAHLLSTYPAALRGSDSSAQLAPWQERKAKELLSANDKGIAISKVAEECRLSRSHFSRAFKKNTGYSPQGWVLKARVEKAKQLLTETRKSIAEIGLDCGFCDQSHFSRVFSKSTGETPFAWRRLMSNIAKSA